METTKFNRIVIGAFMAAATLAALCATNPLRAEEPKPGEPAAQSNGGSKPFDVKSTFRNICGFCHENYGRKEGKGPKLMGSPKTDKELFDRIKNGKPGRMAAFGTSFSDDQINQIVKFIRNLKPDQDP
jgi:mono/diheme cytochrome c family protein